MTRTLLAIVLGATACSSTEEPVESGTPVEETGLLRAGIDPVSFSVSFESSIDADGNLISGPTFPRSDVEPPSVDFVFLAQGAIDGVDLDDACTATAIVAEESRTPIETTAYFPNLDSAKYHQAYLLSLEFEPVRSTCDDKLDERIWGVAGASFFEKWNGATLGVAFAPLSSRPDLDKQAGGLSEAWFFHYVALTKADGTFRGEPLGIGAALEFDRLTNEFTPDPSSEFGFETRNVEKVPAELPITSVSILGSSIAELPLSDLAEDLTR